MIGIGIGRRISIGAHSSGVKQNTNLLTKTEQFDNAAWTKTRTTVSANAANDPYGNATADKIVEDGTATSTHFALQSASLTASTIYTYAIHLKAGERTWAYVAISDKAGALKGSYFNLATGALGTADAGVTASIQSLGNGWYRCRVTVSAGTGASSTNVRIYLSTGNGTISYSGDAASGLYAWGASLNIGSQPDGYVRVA